MEVKRTQQGVVQTLEAYVTSSIREAPQDLAAALGLRKSPRYVGKNVLGFLLFLHDEKDVKEISPNFDALKQVDARNVVVAAKQPDGSGVVFRCFCPRLGVHEDQVTGSACINVARVYAEIEDRYDEWIPARQLSEAGGAMVFNVPSREEWAQLTVLLAGVAHL